MKGQDLEKNCRKGEKAFFGIEKDGIKKRLAGKALRRLGRIKTML
jgi:hypothetical protein